MQKAFSFFGEDSWRATPNLTLNYGMRWDFTFDDHDLTGAYHSALPDSLFGPTAQNQLFQPGALNGNLNPGLTGLPHTYNAFLKSPQPAFGLAYNSKSTGGALNRLLGGDSTVIRAGFNLRNFTEPNQFAWDASSDYGTVYYQFFGANPNTTGAAGTYAPGSVSLGANGPVTTAIGAAYTNYVLTPKAPAQYIPFA